MTRIASIFSMLTFAFLGFSSPQEAGATPITLPSSLPGTVFTDDFSQYDGDTTPANFVFGATVTNVHTVPEPINLSRIAGTAYYFGDFPTPLSPNGDWSTPTPVDGYIGSLGTGAVMRLTFAGGDVAGVGAIFSYSDGATDVTLSAYTAGGAFLESFVFSGANQIIGAGANAGEFRGIRRASVDIGYIEISSGSANRVVLDDLQFTRDPFTAGSESVPEPSTLVLALFGAAGLFMRRRRSNNR